MVGRIVRNRFWAAAVLWAGAWVWAQTPLPSVVPEGQQAAGTVQTPVSSAASAGQEAAGALQTPVPSAVPAGQAAGAARTPSSIPGAGDQAAGVVQVRLGSTGFSAQGMGGMVVSAEKNATEIGAAVLGAGGNAVDAAVAVAYALAVTHPTAGNLGGGGFMLVSMADGRTAAIDYREIAPAGATRTMYQDAQGNLIEGKSTLGGLSAGVPGTVAGLELAREKFGTRPHRDLVLPAVRLARDGHRLDAGHAADMEEVLEDMGPFADSVAIFTKEGKPYQAGDLWIQKDLGVTLQILADQGPQAFYQGELAKRLVAGTRHVGGIWTEEDLAGYRAVERQPLRFDYRGNTVLSMPPPSSGGIVLAQLLRSSEMLGLDKLAPYSADEMHLYAEIARRMYLDRNEWLADPDFISIPVRGLLDSDYLASRLQGIDLHRATVTSTLAAGKPPGSEGEQTTHFSVVDRWGNAVSNTYTLNLNFGSKAVATGTGVLLNNEMDDFAAKPGTPNSFGLVQGEKNAIAPRKRMLSSMTPTIVLKNKKVWLVTGSPGGSTIITTVFQVLRHVVDHGWTIRLAVAAQRIHHQGLPDQFTIEEGSLEPEVQKELEARGHKIVSRGPIGAAHSISVDPVSGSMTGIADPRDSGWAASP